MEFDQTKVIKFLGQGGYVDFSKLQTVTVFLLPKKLPFLATELILLLVFLVACFFSKWLVLTCWNVMLSVLVVAITAQDFCVVVQQGPIKVT